MSTETEKEQGATESSKATGFFARLPFSTVGKIVFWVAIIGTLGGLAGAIAITLGAGAPSRDIVITTICWLAIVVILATRFRWSPLLTTLLGAYNIYLICTQPYAVESFANPKGPNGGYGHFIGDVIILALAIIVFGGSIVAAIENYRQGSRKAPRWLPAALSAVGGMVVGALLIGAVAQPASVTGTTFTNGVPTVHMGAGNFLQTSVTLPKGSKLLLVDDVASLHILANGSWQNGTPQSEQQPGEPVVNNLQVNGGSVEIGPFNTAGTYHIYCKVHQGMNLTVIVQ